MRLVARQVVGQVSISCTTQSTGPGFCTGRRPQGHHEVAIEVDSVGTWLAVHAHLERASVTAFAELASWLERRGAPADLVGRCHDASDDEVRLARLMSDLAQLEGETAPSPESDPPGEDLFEVALHNAVEGCVREAFAAYQARTAAPPFCRVFDAIAQDELRHGQLAWDLHAWLLNRLPPQRRAQVQEALSTALAELPQVAAANARATPEQLGWPSPVQAATMARHFGARLLA